MSDRYRKLKIATQVIIGVGALAFVIIRSDATAIAQALKQTYIPLLPFALLATVATVWLMAYRWGLILRTRGHAIPVSRLFGYYLISNFFSNFVPGGAVTADVTRLLCANREVDDKPLVASTVLYERMIGMFTLLVFGLGASLFGRVFRPTGSVFYVGEAFLALAFIGLAMLMSKRISLRLMKLSKWLGEVIGLPRLGDAGARTLEATAMLRQYKSLAVSTLLVSVLMRLVWSLGAYSIAKAMGLPIGILITLAFVSIVDLIRMLPISVGGLGIREWALISLFGNLGIAREQALVFSLLCFSPLIITSIAGGILYTTLAGAGRFGRKSESGDEHLVLELVREENRSSAGQRG